MASEHADHSITPRDSIATSDHRGDVALDEVAAEIAASDHVDILIDHELDDRWAEVFGSARPKAHVRLRVRDGVTLDLNACAWLRATEVVLELCSADSPQLENAPQLADALGADVTCCFVLTASRWHELDSARAAAQTAGLRFSVALTQRSDELQRLSPQQLDLLAVTLKEYERSEGGRGLSSMPAALGALRAMLVQKIREELARPDAAADSDDFTLSSGSNDNSALGEACRTAIWKRSHTTFITRWVERQLAVSGGEFMREGWQRALAQKVAWESRSPEVLNSLRDLYQGPERQALIDGDVGFAAGFDLSTYGGPWHTTLGLDHPDRVAPFAIPEASACPDEAAAKITVLIPSYCHEAFIEETIRSVLGQDFPAFKLLVVDDCSADGTVAAARSIKDPRIEVRENSQNMGLGNSVMQALQSVDTPYVTLLNSDDLFHPERLKQCVSILDEDAGAQVVTTALSLIDSAGGGYSTENTSIVLDGLQIYDWVRWYHEGQQAGAQSSDDLFTGLLERNFLATSSNLAVRTQWLRERAAELTELKYCLDWQIFLDAALEGSLRHIDRPLMAYRLHASNTVWFEPGDRWAFYLEVNRVIAAAVQKFVDLHPHDDPAMILKVVEATAAQIQRNSSADGMALFLNSVLDAPALDQVAARSQSTRTAIAQMLRQATSNDSASEAELHERALQDSTHRLTALLNQYERDVANDAHGELREELSERVKELRERVKELRERDTQSTRRYESGREQLAQHKQRAALLEARITKAVEDRKALQERIAKAAEDRKALQERVAKVTEGREALQAQLNERITGMREALEQSEKRWRDIRGRLDERRDQLQRAQKDRQQTAESLQASRADVKKIDGDLASERRESSMARAECERLERLVSETRKHHEAAVKKLNHRRAEVIRMLTESRAQMDSLRHSREYRTGNYLWNTLPFGYMSRKGKKWYSRLLAVKDRFALWAGGKLSRPTADGVAVVAATWQWPIYSHTFVYQEMLALSQMGFEVRLFHWKANDMNEMQPAFAPLSENRIEIRPSLPQHRGDRDYWDKRSPGKLDQLLARIGEVTGRTVEDLREDPQVLRACTFARNAELSHATYLHSYFFYDQSFMVFITAWLLDLPRGVSCYADHMMDDYPFKLVAMQIEMASVVVATSARIKEELVGIAGEAHAHKIVVKPNGVNGERFPAIDRGVRDADEPFEVISISRLEPKKGLEYMIEAIAELKRRGRKIKVHIVGAVDTSIQASIDYGVEIEQQIQELGLQEEVILHGMMMHEQIQPIMQRCRAFIAPYVELDSGDKDGIPTAMLEALASGLPIVTTDSGSILEVVQDGVQALVTPQRDSDAYAEALDRLITEPALERTLATNARQRFDEEFDIKVTERKLHERVAAALQQRNVAAR